MTQIIDRSGQAQEINLSVDDYKAAYSEKKSLPQYLNSKFDTDVEKFGTPFEQVLASNRLFTKSDNMHGLKPPSMAQVLDGSMEINMGAITRPDGNGAQTVSGRLLFPAIVLEMVEASLREDNTTYEAAFNKMIATTLTVNSPRVDQPIINMSAPRTKRSQPIAQLAEPPAMVTISLSEKSFRLPTVSIGLEIANEALEASTLDLVGISLREQGLAERAAIIDESIQKMVNGDTDLGMSALSSVTAASFDSSIIAAGKMTRQAYLLWLRSQWKKLNIDWVITDVLTYLAIEDTVKYDLGSTRERLNSLPHAANPGIPDNVNYFLVDTALLGANTMVGLDSTRAIRKVVNVSADYSAIEEFVLRKSKAFRYDFSVGYFRLFDEAFRKMTLTV